MEKKTSLFSHSLLWGAILGIILVVYSLILYFLDQSTNKGLGYVTWIIIIVCLFYAMKSYRDSVNQGTLSYGNAFVIGLLVAIIAGFISSVFTYIQFRFISPEIIDKMLQMTEDKLMSKGMSDDMIEKSIEMSKKFMTPIIMSIMGFIMTVIIGGILSLIIAAIAKKDPETSVA